MRDILTGIGAALLISLCIVFVLGCSNSQDEFDEVSRSIDKQIEMVGAMNRTIDAITKEAEEAIKTRQGPYPLTMISHGVTNTFIITPDRHDDAIQEFRQQITDLQNRVYELEND